MNLLFTLIIAMLAAYPLSAQHRILRWNDEPLENVEVHEIKEEVVVYKQHNSLHDVRMSDIKIIVLETQLIRFDEEGHAIYSEKTADSPWTRDMQASVDQVSDHSFCVFVTPTALLGLFTSFQGGLEFRLSQKWSALAELGYISHGWLLEDLTPSTVDGWTGQGSLRYYPKESARFLLMKGRPFVEAEGFSRHIQMHNSRGTRISVKGGHLKTGIQKILPNGLMLESWIGLGITQKVFSIYPSTNVLFGIPFINEDGILPTLTTGFKIGLSR
ncbi:MAG: hypothetical protein AAF587_11490 [Bacteroidota bacterium]